MRYPVGDSGDEVEVGQYYEINRGPFKATFTLIIYPRGQKILNCEYMVSEKRTWWIMPHKKVDVEGKEYPERIPYVSYLDKDYRAELVATVLKALKDQKHTERHGKTNHPQKKNTLQVEPCADPGELPF